MGDPLAENRIISPGRRVLTLRPLGVWVGGVRGRKGFRAEGLAGVRRASCMAFRAEAAAFREDVRTCASLPDLVRAIVLEATELVTSA
mmetsp:Transcript_4125/g.7931  ORF Transcript_4125/g.7931 Transcript_4125/m.7931 type:complete len:88 (+) Transcript_4125:179-442(+)